MDGVVEKVARALWTTPLHDQPKPNYVREWPPQDLSVKAELLDQARAAIAAMLEAVGEPVAWLYALPDGELSLSAYRNSLGHPDNEGWTETPLYSLSPLTQALAVQSKEATE